MKFYERKEIKDILAYIRIIFNPLDSMSLKRIINVPGRKIGEKSLENFLDILEREKLNVGDFSENDFLIQSLSGIGAKWIEAFCNIYKFLREESKTKSVNELMQSIIKRTNYEEYLKWEYSEDEYEGNLRISMSFSIWHLAMMGCSIQKILQHFLKILHLLLIKIEKMKKNDLYLKDLFH